MEELHVPGHHRAVILFIFPLACLPSCHSLKLIRIFPDFIEQKTTLKVENTSHYQLVYSIRQHSQMGAIIEPFVVALTAQRTLSLTYQKVFSGNASYYDRLSQHDLELISLLDPIMAENIVKRFSPVQRIRPKEYFKKYFKRDEFKKTARPFIEGHLVELLRRLDPERDLLYLADEINPASERIEITTEFSKVLFHFRRNEFGTRYFATIKYKEERQAFMKVGAVLMTNQPAFLVVHGRLLRFYDFVEGNKLGAFLHRKYIQIKPAQEEAYYQQYVVRLMERSPIYAEGFLIENQQHQAQAVLALVNEEHFALKLYFEYDGYRYAYHPTKHYHVRLEWNDQEPRFIRVRRARKWEDDRVKELEFMGWKYINNRFQANPPDLAATLSKLGELKVELQAKGYQIVFETAARYQLEKPSIHYRIADKLDWFDLHIMVEVGDFRIPFKDLIPYIKDEKAAYPLPDGSVFLIPESWFALGRKLEGARSAGKGFKVAKYQLDILEGIASKKIKKHLNQLNEISEEQTHPHFCGTLRNYQLDGLSWLMFLYRNYFGGILADDMGLGKTVQTLAFIQKLKYEVESQGPFLLVAPTSLLFNWKQEAEQFTPDLSVYVHSGLKRYKSVAQFNGKDLIITSYGLIRNDIELWKEMHFTLIVLDESQHIKNSSAKSTQMVNKLSARQRICLSGTPIENSVRDLWSQMNFLNKGMLGSAKQFEQKFVKPIEKDKNEDASEQLKKMVKPFVLRRTKEQVAKELPALTEKTIFCEMSPEQSELYEEIKSEYRNALLNLVEEQGIDKSRMSILQGLTKLRLLANHPVLLDSSFQGSSGKHQMLLDHIATAVDEGHKVLVFSQFVRYLNQLEKDLRKRKIPLLMLTGSTPSDERRSMVGQFQKEGTEPVFLISLKAGGVGLNLTAADYVFIADPWWNPASEAQARDRTHRIGQRNKVISYKFISTDTVEEKILQLQQKKKWYASEVIQVEENVMKSLKQSDLVQLFN